MESEILRTQGLTKRYGEVLAVDHLDLSIARGEVFGLLGPNGAGKTTTTLMLLGLTEPTGGTAYIEGHNCTREPLAVKALVGYLPDSVGFYPDLTGRENLCFTGALNGLSPAECASRADRLLERVGMTYAAHRRAGGYSRGMRQRLGIADVLMKDPQVIILDEPTLGIDPEGVRELIALIRELAVEDGRTVLISSHQLYQIQQICDRVGLFVQGKLMACGPIGELGRQLGQEDRFRLEIRLAGSALVKDIGALEGVCAVERDAGGVLHVSSTRDIRLDLTQLAAQKGVPLLELHQQGGSLEEIYHKYFAKAGDWDASGQHPAGGRGRRPGLLARLARRPTGQ